MAGFEVAMGPNFLSQDNYEVLGCSRLATTGDLARAFQSLAWKHHPQNLPNDEEATRIFVRVCEAYAALAGDDVGEEHRGEGLPFTLNEAKRAYENKFGKFRKLYWGEGGIIGLPHAFVLSGRAGEQNNSRGSCVCGKVRVGILRSWYLKMTINLVLSVTEVVLTLGTIAACTYFRIRQMLFLLVVQS
jgi:hypothetical protein